MGRTQSQNYDIIYIAYQQDSIDLPKANCFFGMTFRISRNVNRAYLTYPNGEKLRFYPQQLQVIIPRFFKRPDPSTISDYDYLTKIHSNSFKNAFCLNLNDEDFDKKYKMLTGVDHICINYNRLYVRPSEYECTVDNILELADCHHLQIIIKSLTLFKRFDHIINDQNMKAFNLQSLSKAYDHIISGHKFCLNQQKKKKIQKFVAERIGDCKILNKNCNVLSAHSQRRRERSESDFKEEHKMENPMKEILIATLNSLHAYLVHTDMELFRLRQNDKNAALRFVEIAEQKIEEKKEEN